MIIIITVLLLVIIFLLIFNLIRMERFQVKCPPYSVRLGPENSQNAVSKGWCTNASFEDGEAYDDNSSNNVESDRCLANQTYVKASNSYDSESKGFCKG